jgi:hypothetical protein
MKNRIFACVLIGVMLLGITACGSLPELSDLIGLLDQENDTPQSQSTGDSDPIQSVDPDPYPGSDSANNSGTDSSGNNDSQGGVSSGSATSDGVALNFNTRRQTMGNREVFVADDMEDIVMEYLLAISQNDLEKAFACIYFEDATFLSVDDLRTSVMTTNLNQIAGSKITDMEISGSAGSDVRRCDVRITFEDESTARLSVDSMLTSDFVWMVTKPELYHANWEIRVPSNVDVYLNGIPLPVKDSFMDGGRPVHIIPCMTKRVSEVYFVSSEFGRYSEEFTPVQSRERFNYFPDITDELFRETTTAVKDLLEKLYAHMVNGDDLKDTAYLFTPGSDMSIFANMYTDGVNRRSRLSDFVVRNVVTRNDHGRFIVGNRTVMLNLGFEISWMDDRNRSRFNRINSWIALAREDGQWYIHDISERVMTNVNGSLRDW